MAAGVAVAAHDWQQVVGQVGAVATGIPPIEGLQAAQQAAPQGACPLRERHKPWSAQEPLGPPRFYRMQCSNV